MTYMKTIDALNQLSDEEILDVYERDVVYLTPERTTFITLYNQRLGRDRTEYIPKEEDTSPDLGTGTTLSQEDRDYIARQEGLVENDETKVELSTDEMRLLSYFISGESNITRISAVNHINSMSCLFLLSMLSSLGTVIPRVFEYGTNPTLDAMNKDAHIHLHNLFGFIGICEVCLSEVRLEDSIRKPKMEGGWEGWYCSENCMSRYVIQTEGEALFHVYLAMLKLISV